MSTHKTVQRVELGCPGHLIVADSCRWRRHTQVGNYRISSIGNYYPRGAERGTLGASKDSFFETMVFKTLSVESGDNEGCGCKQVADWCEIDGRRYATAGAAQAGHEAFVKKYAALAWEDGK